MAPIIPDPKRIRSFRTEAAFESWLAANHARETELWLKSHKKESGLPTVSCAEALDVGALLGVDRRHPEGLRRPFVPAAVHPSQSEKRLEPDQPRPRRATDHGEAHDSSRWRFARTT